jgi:hypothetical protein
MIPTYPHKAFFLLCEERSKYEFVFKFIFGQLLFLKYRSKNKLNAPEFLRCAQGHTPRFFKIDIQEIEGTCGI